MAAMWSTRGVLALVVLVGCVASSKKHVERGNRLLARGDLDSAESAYNLAIADQENDPWVRAKVDKGLAEIELERMRKQGSNVLAERGSRSWPRRSRKSAGGPRADERLAQLRRRVLKQGSPT